MTAPRNTLTLICGNAGVGKSTLGRRLARESGSLLLDIDTVSEKLVVAGLVSADRDPNDRDSAEFKRTYREAIHETLFKIANENLDHAPCIVVAPFTKERRDSDFPKRLATRLSCTVNVIFVWCSDETRRQRIEKRGNLRDRFKLSAWDAYVAEGRDPHGRPPFAHTFVDTTRE